MSGIGNAYDRFKPTYGHHATGSQAPVGYQIHHFLIKIAAWL
jgi:hypothetical protein